MKRMHNFQPKVSERTYHLSSCYCSRAAMSKAERSDGALVSGERAWGAELCAAQRGGKQNPGPQAKPIARV